VVEDADDELILIYQRVGGENIRQVSVDENNNIWTGANFGNNNTFSLLDGATGAILAETDFNAGGYGGLMDGNGVLWAASRTGTNPGLTNGVGLVRYDTKNTVTTADDSLSILEAPNSYGLGIDSSGNIWNAQFTSGTIRKFSPAGDLASGFPKAVGGNGCRGVAVTSLDDDAWIANSASDTVSRLDNDGNILKIIPVGNQPTGVAVDANGEVWVTNLDSNNVMRIDPNAGGDALGAVDMTVDLGEDAGPYNYSDMTGFVAIGATAQQGTWTVIYDSQEQDTDFDLVSWASNEPAGTSITVEVRAANDIQELPMESFVPVLNGVGFSGIVGQFIEIQVSFTRTPGQTEDSPELFDLTVEGAVALDCIPADTDCDGDVDGVDFAKFASCFNGAGKPPRTLGCSPELASQLDFEPDMDVDGVDFSKFASCFNGAGKPPRTLGCPGT
jgi:DNA-binding beta-propeller fold protein YncE